VDRVAVDLDQLVRVEVDWLEVDRLTLDERRLEVNRPPNGRDHMWGEGLDRGRSRPTGTTPNLEDWCAGSPN